MRIQLLADSTGEQKIYVIVPQVIKSSFLKASRTDLLKNSVRVTGLRIGLMYALSHECSIHN